MALAVKVAAASKLIESDCAISATCAPRTRIRSANAEPEIDIVA